METREKTLRENLKRIDAAEDFETEQKLMIGHPKIDICEDLPMDCNRVWRLRSSDMTGEDLDSYRKICQSFDLPFEKGARAYYVPKSQLIAVFDKLTENGFLVSLSMNAAQNYNKSEVNG